MKNIDRENPVVETYDLSIYLMGLARGMYDKRLEKAAEYLEELSRHICGGGVIGCDGGIDCHSDHK